MDVGNCWGKGLLGECSAVTVCIIYFGYVKEYTGLGRSTSVTSYCSPMSLKVQSRVQHFISTVMPRHEMAGATRRFSRVHHSEHYSRIHCLLPESLRVKASAVRSTVERSSEDSLYSNSRLQLKLHAAENGSRSGLHVIGLSCVIHQQLGTKSLGNRHWGPLPGIEITVNAR